MASVLLAVSDPRTLHAMRGPLRRLAGQPVHEVHNGVSASSALSAQLFDLAVVDAELKGRSGIQICRDFRANGGLTPFVLVANKDSPLTLALADTNPGADEFLILPLAEAELFARLGSLLRSGQVEQQMRRHSDELESRIHESTSQLEEMAARLRTERDALKETFNIIEDGLLLLDAGGRVKLENAASAKIRQRCAPKLRSGVVEEAVASLAARALAQGGRCEAQIGGTGCSLRLLALPAGGDRALVSVRDVTGDQEQEVRRMQAEKLASIGMLAAGVAHEINNPASFVLANVDALNGLLQVLQSNLEAHPEAASALGAHDLVFEAMAILQESKEGMARIYRIVRDLRAFAHVDDDVGRETNVNDAIESSLSLVRNELRHNTSIERSLNARRLVRGGVARLGQVFVNLIVNAGHAMSEQAGPQRNRLSVRSRDEGEWVVVEIEDNGPGMPPEVLERVFEAFYTTKPRGVGTGLGLPISRDIVKGLGGQMSARSEVGRGSLFEIRLPAAVGHKVDDSDSVPATLVRRRLRILAVDDEVLLLKAYRRMLIDHHDVVTESAGLLALSRLEQDAAFDIVLCDLHMPGMNGASFFEKVQSRWPGLSSKFIFITGGAFTSETKAFLAQAASHCINKPFHLDELLKLIETIQHEGVA